MTTGAARGPQLLRLVHASPGLTRAEVAHALGASTGTTTEVVTRLVAEHLLQEGAPTSGGRRGRPTRPLSAHPQGPLVLAAVVSHESWRLQAVQLGGTPVAATGGHHDGTDPARVLAAVRDAARRTARRFPGRVRGCGLAVPGLVTDGHRLHAPLLGWSDVDLRRAWPRDLLDGTGTGTGTGTGIDGDLLVAGNDARLAAVGESARGAAVGARAALHLHLDAGLGGALTAGGVLVDGARGTAGEFGHLPFGDPAVRCGCGAGGCWGTALDGAALARALGEPVPRDPVASSHRVLDRAAAGEAGAGAAVRGVAAALGRGAAGLVNALDADLVTLGGLGVRVAEVAGDVLQESYRAGLMAFRRADPPPVRAAALGEDGPLTGAAELVWSRLWPRC
ncbi:ROK family protein [Kineococcus sp. T13]|uniref:ROK family protein n=1 Tax=Kineococcus vitellinus TaxID=2696565 RepID=UPI00141267DE|nr:ROK family protein [Kineococcus vitellinus]NAZ76150.1 ROK family protein [Kineococcus vitellinus]